MLRFDQTHIGEAKVVVLVDGLQAASGEDELTKEELASRFGLRVKEPYQGLVAWDVMDAILAPGDTIALTSWRTEEEAAKFCATIPCTLRYRMVRIIRDYGMYDRREAPQFYSDARGRETIH